MQNSSELATARADDAAPEAPAASSNPAQSLAVPSKTLLSDPASHLTSQERRIVMIRTLAFSVLAVAGVLSTMLLPCRALAQDPTPEGGAEASASDPKPASKPSSGGGKRISLDDEFLVEGKLEKPSAFFVFKRSALDYDWARLDAQFTPLVLESVQDPLF